MPASTPGCSTATNLFDQDRADSGRVANGLARETAADDPSMNAIRDGNAADVLNLWRGRTRAPRDQLRLDHRLVRPRDGRRRLAARSPPPRSTWSARTAGQVGTIAASTTSRDAYLREVEATTGEDAALIGPHGTVAGGPGVAAGDLPSGGEATDVERGDEQLRAAATEPLGAEQVRVALFAPAVDEGFFGSRPNDRDRAGRVLRGRAGRRGAHPPLAAGLRPRDARRGAPHRRG